jgi:hypothetical protein
MSVDGDLGHLAEVVSVKLELVPRSLLSRKLVYVAYM